MPRSASGAPTRSVVPMARLSPERHGVHRRALWVAWERHRRSREICGALGVPLAELAGEGGAWRYPRLLFRTFAMIRRERPDVLFVQCPSIVLGVWAGLLKRVYRFTLVADLHNEAVQPFVCRARWYLGLVMAIRRLADLSLVSNEALERTVNATGGRAFVLPDPVPVTDGARVAGARGEGAIVLFVCSFAPDEPYVAVIEAARRLPPDVRVLITGDRRRAVLPRVVPANVRFTGFLPQAEYDALLVRAAVIVDLTEMQDCLVCGAYEAVAARTPLVTSDTAVLRRHFAKGTVFTRHDPASIAAAISRALDEDAALRDGMRLLHRDLTEQWTTGSRQLLTLLELGN